METLPVSLDRCECTKGTKKSPCSGPGLYGGSYGVTCPWCGDKYYRCDAHGALKGAKRSLTWHKGICRSKP